MDGTVFFRFGDLSRRESWSSVIRPPDFDDLQILNRLNLCEPKFIVYKSLYNTHEHVVGTNKYVHTYSYSISDLMVERLFNGMLFTLLDHMYVCMYMQVSVSMCICILSSITSN